MEVILKKDVENLGFTDDLVEVKNGYGRNFLIPQGFAILATTSAKKVLAETMRQRAHRDAKLIEDAKKIAKTLEGVSLKIIAKTADGVKLFGSVNNGDVAEEFTNQGHDIDRKFINIDGRNIKRTGSYLAHVRLHRELIVDIPFEIVADPKSLPKKVKAEKIEEETAENTEKKDVDVLAKESIDDVLGSMKKSNQDELKTEMEVESDIDTISENSEEPTTPKKTEE